MLHPCACLYKSLHLEAYGVRAHCPRHKLYGEKKRDGRIEVQATPFPSRVLETLERLARE
jgi:hypothetical protein